MRSVQQPIETCHGWRTAGHSMRSVVTISATLVVAIAALGTCGVSFAATTPTTYARPSSPVVAVQRKPPPRSPGVVCTWERPTFNPRVASPEELRAHGDFPQRPVGNRRATQDWDHYVAMYLAGDVRLCTGPGVPGPFTSGPAVGP